MRQIRTSADFAIRGESLRVEDVSARLQLSPTDSFEKGDWYKGREKVGGEIREVGRTRHTGIWHYDTEFQLQSASIKDHVRLLVSVLAPSRDAIKAYVNDDKFFVRVLLWHVGDSGFGLPSELVKQLAEFCEEIQVTCWSDDEANS